MTALELIRTAVRMRRAMLWRGASKKPVAITAAAMRRVEPWVKAFPNATERGARKFIRRHYSDLVILLPGGDHPAAEKMRRALDRYAFGEAAEIEVNF